MNPSLPQVPVRIDDGTLFDATIPTVLPSITYSPLRGLPNPPSQIPKAVSYKYSILTDRANDGVTAFQFQQSPCRPQLAKSELTSIASIIYTYLLTSSRGQAAHISPNIHQTMHSARSPNLKFTKKPIRCHFYIDQYLLKLLQK